MAADEPRDHGLPGLSRLARLHGIQTRYRDLGGTWRPARGAALRAALGGMGVDTDGEARVEDALRARLDEIEARVLAPCTPVDVGPEDVPPEVVLALHRADLDAPVRCFLRSEDGLERDWKPSARRVGAGPGERVRIAVPLPQPLPAGYHELEVVTASGRSRTLVLAAPSTTWRPPEDQLRRDWGVFMPLYALRSARSWGTGDLRDFERLLEWIDRLGGASVGTLPMLAGDDGGRGGRIYDPVSRLFWHAVYLDPERAPELQRSADARRLLESSGFQKRIADLRARDEVDWRASIAAKREVLEILARDTFAQGLPEAARSFVAAHPEVEEFSRFMAAWEARGEPWGRWPASSRCPPLPASDRDREAAKYHVYVQWLAHRQMRGLRERRGATGAKIYLDLPVGCGPDGYDAWRYQDRFAAGIAVGAPPDAFFRAGQNWGFPPLSPDAMVRSGFAYTIAALRHHMGVASRLRLDHVMSLHRLFWIPDGMSPADGVYVRYPHESLYAILRIESHRHRTAVVGEDLGTVPREVRRSMTRNGVERMYVAQFEARPRKAPALPPPPRRAVVSLNTHDMPTFAGFWSETDIDLRERLAQLDPAEVEEERNARAEVRSSWVRFLQDGGLLEDGAEPPDPAPVHRATLRSLARSRASLLQINLEDLWSEKRPQNVPGTGPEQPNFLRKARMSLEEMIADESMKEVLREVDRLRDPAAGVEAAGRSGEARSAGADAGAAGGPEKLARAERA